MVITTIGMSEGELTAATAAAFVGAGMLSVLVFPLAADRIRGTSRSGVVATGDPGDAL